MILSRRLFISFYFLSLIGCGIVKTGTIADVNYSPNFFNFDTKIQVEDGKIVKFPIRTNERRINSIKDAESKYIKGASGYFIQNSEFQNTESIMRKSEITGREKMVEQYKMINQGYILKYNFTINKEIIPKMEKVKIEILRADKTLELIAEHFVKTGTSIPRENYIISSTGYFGGESRIIINHNDYIKGDRKYMYIFKITLEDESKKIDEVYVAFTSRYHDRGYQYVQGHI